MGRWLSSRGRWGSPVLIAGESYGGYRVGRLARMLQETGGIGLNGAILISPALEITALLATDYDVVAWIDKVPTMAAAAFHHGRSRAFPRESSLEQVFAGAEAFATGDYASFLTRGASMAGEDRDRVVATLADMLGLPLDVVVRAEGRVSMATFARELLRDQRKVLGLQTRRSPPRTRSRTVSRTPDPIHARRDEPRVHDGGEPDAPVRNRRGDRP